MSRIGLHIAGVGLLVSMFGCGSSAQQTPASSSSDEISTPRPAPQPAAEEPLPADADVVKVNEPGQEVELEPIVASGKVTVVEFYAEWCAPCRDVERRVLAVMSAGSAVALRKVDVGEDHDTPVAKQHKVKTVPSVLIYDREGELRYTLEGKKCAQAAEIAGQLAR